MKTRKITFIVWMFLLFSFLDDFRQPGDIYAARLQNQRLTTNTKFSKKKNNPSVITSRKALKKILLKHFIEMEGNIRLEVSKSVLKNMNEDYDAVFNEMMEKPLFAELRNHLSFVTHYIIRDRSFLLNIEVSYHISKEKYLEVSQKKIKVIKSKKKLYKEIVDKFSNLSREFTVYFDSKILEVNNKSTLSSFLNRIQNEPFVRDVTEQGIKYRKSNYGKISGLHFSNNSEITKGELKELKNFVKSWVKKNIEAEMTDEEKVRTINDFMVKEYRYTFGNDPNANRYRYTSSEKIGKYSIFTSFALLKEKGGVCDAKSCMFYRLAKEAGLKALYIHGKGNGGPHSWNMVKVDGSWYHIDNTWNRASFEGSSEYEYFNTREYYLKSDDTFRKSHEWDCLKFPEAPKDYFPVPEARFEMFSLQAA